MFTQVRMVLFGLLPGFAEEIDWTGFALPRMLAGGSALWAALGLGVLWAVWHLPVVNFLGSASPHGAYWLPFFLAFASILVAMRVLMAWVYCKTRSVLLAQLMHASSTGALVVFGPDGISPAQEAAWYGLYGAALCVMVIVLVSVEGRNLGVHLERQRRGGTLPLPPGRAPSADVHAEKDVARVRSVRVEVARRKRCVA